MLRVGGVKILLNVIQGKKLKKFKPPLVVAIYILLLSARNS